MAEGNFSRGVLCFCEAGGARRGHQLLLSWGEERGGEMRVIPRAPGGNRAAFGFAGLKPR